MVPEELLVLSVPAGKCNPAVKHFNYSKINNLIIMIRKPVLFLIIVLFTAYSPERLFAHKYSVKSLPEYHIAETEASAGDTIYWQAGTYRDVDLVISRDRISILAERPGATLFTGSSKVEIRSSYVTFGGFQFTGGKADGDVIKVSGSHNLLGHLNVSGYHSNYYLNVTASARHNTIACCNFEKKPEDKTTSVVQIQVDEKEPGYHKLRYCSFKNHTAPPGAGGDYGIEALRIGYSFQSKFISRTIVEYCYFSRCNGDGEIISSKARENIYRYNTFEDNGESHFTLRHGCDNVLYGNFFLKGAGLRIKEGQNHMVYNNFFQTGEYFAIRLENYKVDPLENIMILHNTFSGSGDIRFGGRGDFQPERVQVVNNLFLDPAGAIISDMTGRETFQGNIVHPQERLPALTGFSHLSVQIENVNGWLQPQLPVIGGVSSLMGIRILDIPELDDDPAINLDIAGNKRPEVKKSAGCYEPGHHSNPVKPYATALNTGPSYLQGSL